MNRDNEVTNWSGKGPSPCDATIYPELVAPGTKVRSAWPGGVRKNLKGTSMAAPHVAGTGQGVGASIALRIPEDASPWCCCSLSPQKASGSIYDVGAGSPTTVDLSGFIPPFRVQ